MEGIVTFDTLEWSNVRSERGGGAQKTLQAKSPRSSLADFIASEQCICLCSFVTEDTYPGAWSAGAPSVAGKYGYVRLDPTGWTADRARFSVAVSASGSCDNDTSGVISSDSAPERRDLPVPSCHVALAGHTI